MYAVVGYLDERSEKTIQSVGDDLFELEYCNQVFKPMEGMISEVGLIKVNIDDKGRATSEVLSVFSFKKD